MTGEKKEVIASEGGLFVRETPTGGLGRKVMSGILRTDLHKFSSTYHVLTLLRTSNLSPPIARRIRTSLNFYSIAFILPGRPFSKD